MTLFDSDPKYREKATIFRVLSLLPLFQSLLSGCVCRWFTTNIPMDLGVNDRFAGDIDILACLRRWPNNRSPWPDDRSPWPSETPKGGLFYRTWEVKVATLHENGDARSVKGGKTRKILSQLHTHRKFGSPNVSLLDFYLCEANIYADGKVALPLTVQQAIQARFPELKNNQYGYQVLPFGHYKVEDDDFGLFTMNFGPNIDTALDFLYPKVSPPQQPFSSLASQIDSL